MLQELRRLGIEVAATDEGNLKLRGAEPTPELRARIKESKRVILALLKREGEMDALIDAYVKDPRPTTEVKRDSAGNVISYRTTYTPAELELVRAYMQNLNTKVAVVAAALRAQSRGGGTIRDYLPLQPSESILNQARGEV